MSRFFDLLSTLVICAGTLLLAFLIALVVGLLRDDPRRHNRRD
jgi:hypothetical protein